MKAFIILVVIVSLTVVFVEASGFTGTYSDMGLDTNSDSLFEFLVVNTGVSITTSGYYSVFGELKDNSGNLQESKNCTYLPAGTVNFPLKFDGIEIYTNKVNGPYNLSYIELSYMADGCSGQPPYKPDDSRNNPYITNYYSYTEFQPPLIHPAAYCTSSPCIATATCAGNEEQNSPNTIDGCQDGNSGICHADESIENITITNLDGVIFSGGGNVKVEAVLYCNSGDNINFAYTNSTNNPDWRVLNYVYCNGNSFQTHSTSFRLDNVEGNHTIRAIIQNSGSPTTTCGQGQYDDNDDVTILVYKSGIKRMNIPLIQGWNLISIPLDLQNKTIKNIFDSVNYSEIYTYDNGNYILLNENNETDIKKGYWINVNDNFNLTVEGTMPSYPILFNIKTGWNLIGYPYLYDKNINASSINNIIKKINTFDNSWKTYSFNKPPSLNSLQSFSSAHGYWIYSDKNIQLESDSGVFSVYNPTRTINFNLDSGWNLISIPLNLTNNTVADVFKNLNPNSIYTYDNDYVLLNESSTISPQIGLWVNMPSPGTLTITGKEVLNPVIELNPGWNFVGYPKLSQKSITLYYNKPGIETVFNYNNNWSSYSPKKNYKLNSLKILKPGRGYWVYSNSSTSIQFS